MTPAVVVAALVVAATAPAAPVPTRDCRSASFPASGRLTFNRNDLVVGPVAFSGLRVFDPRSVSQHPGFFSRKLGLKVRAGKPVTLVVPASARGRLWLAYARETRLDDDRVRLVETRFEPCPPRNAVVPRNEGRRRDRIQRRVRLPTPRLPSDRGARRRPRAAVPRPAPAWGAVSLTRLFAR